MSCISLATIRREVEMDNRQTPIEVFYEQNKDCIELDMLGLFDAMNKTRFASGSWVFNAVYNASFGDFDKQGYKGFTNKDDLMGFVFDQCETGTQEVIGMYYSREDGMLSIFMARRKEFR